MKGLAKMLAVPYKNFYFISVNVLTFSSLLLQPFLPVKEEMKL